jgi:predicted nucleotidyltransferase
MENVNFNNERVAALCNRYHPKTLRVFGSVARNEATSESDIDLLVTFSKPISLLQLVCLEQELSSVLGRKVDLLTTKSMSPYLRARIIKEARPIYAA